MGEAMAAAKQRAAAEMHRIDTYGDGSISRAEYVAAGGKQSDFDRFDWDGSGSLDRDELEAMAAAKQRAAAEMHRIDTDGDGSISRAEFVAAGGKQSDFDRFDYDGSGMLDRDELEAMAAAKQRAAAEMHRIDTDGDGSISRAQVATSGIRKSAGMTAQEQAAMAALNAEMEAAAGKQAGMTAADLEHLESDKIMELTRSLERTPSPSRRLTSSVSPMFSPDITEMIRRSSPQ